MGKIIRLANDEKIRHKQGLIKMSSIPCRSLPKPTSVVENRKNINNIARKNEILSFKNETFCITELENMTSTLIMQKKYNKYFKIIMETSLGDKRQVLDILLIEAEYSRMKRNTNKYLSEVFDEIWNQDLRITSKITNKKTINKKSHENFDIKCVNDKILPLKDYLKSQEIEAKCKSETATRLENTFITSTNELLREEKNIMSEIKECINDLQKNLRFLTNLKNDISHESYGIVERTNHLRALSQKKYTESQIAFR